MEKPKTTFQKYEEGELLPVDALREVLQHIRRLEDRIAPLNDEMKVLREQASILTEVLGGEWEEPGLGICKNLAPFPVKSLKQDRLKGVVRELKAAGNLELARQIEECWVEEYRAGYFRIDKPKAKEEPKANG